MLIHANLGRNKQPIPIAFVAVGGEFGFRWRLVRSSHGGLAMLVGSIGWSKKHGDKVVKGEELGWFQVSPGKPTDNDQADGGQYGGSTTICVFPSAAGMAFDQDIATNSEHSMETLVRVGMEIAKVQ